MRRGIVARAAAGRKSAQTDAVARSSGLSQFRSGRPYQPDWNITRSVRDGWQRSVWVYRSVHVIVTAQCKLPVVARRMKPGEPPDPFEGDIIPGHPISTLLNNRPSPNELAYAFRYRKHATDLLCPRGSYVETISNGLADVLQLTLLPPHLTSPIPDPKTFVSGYQVQLGQGSAERVTVQPQNVIWTRRPHPLDPYASMTPLEAAGLAVETDWEARLYQRNYMKNDGLPAGLIRVKGQMTDGDAKDIKAEITGGGGPRNANRVSVVSADEIDVVKLSESMRDMDYTAGRKAMREEIFAAYGLDESIATGNTGLRTYDNVDAAKVNFWTELMLDELTMQSQSWSALDPDPDVVIGFDISRVGPLQRVRRDVAKFFLAEVTAGTRTPDEYRPLSPEPLEPLNSDTSGKLRSDVQAAQAAAALEAGLSDQATGTEGDQSGTTSEPAKSGRKAADTRQAAPTPGVVDAQRQKITDVLAALYVRQGKVVEAKLRGPKARRGTWLARPPGAKAVDLAAVWDDHVWDAQLRADITPTLTAAYDALGEDLAGQLGASWLQPNADLSPLIDRVVGTNQTTKASLAAALAESPGDTLDSVAGRVAELFDQATGSRATTIGTTEATAVAGFAVYSLAASLGQDVTQVWQTGSNPRLSHVQAGGQTRLQGEFFDVAQSHLLYPGDPNGDAEAVVNCNCSLALIVGGEQLGTLESRQVVT